MRNSYRTRTLLAAASIVAFAAGSAVIADEMVPAPASAGAEVVAPAPDTTTPQAGEVPATARIARDPKTGKLRPTTAAEAERLSLKMQEFWARFPRHAVKTDKKTGVTSLVIAPYGMAAAVAARDANGNLVWDCVDPSGVEAKVLELAASSETTPQPEER